MVRRSRWAARGSSGLALSIVAACAAAGAVPAGVGGYVRLRAQGVACYWPAIKAGGAFGWTDGAGQPAASAFSRSAGAWNAAHTRIDLVQGAGSGIVADDPDLGNTGEDGITYFSCQSSGQFTGPVRADVNSYYTAGYTTNERISVTSHELGHAAAALAAYNAGCRAVEEIYTNVRYGRCGVTGPRADDVRGTNALYGAP